MICTVEHTTSYQYDSAVFLEPQRLRLYPLLEYGQFLRDYQLTIVPQPLGMSTNLETDGSVSRLLWFGQECREFFVQARLSLELTQTNPFAFVIFPDSCQSLPMQYPKPMDAELSGYIALTPSLAPVADFAYEILRESKGETLRFLTTLCRRIKEDFTYETRCAGEPYPAVKTLMNRRGSCRDFAVLFIEATRAVGLASRFVSGYYFDQIQPQLELHAWAQTYIPGAGWRGFDPTLGLVCFGHHLALSSGAVASMAAVISGDFRGKAHFVMNTELKVQYSRENVIC